MRGYIGVTDPDWFRFNELSRHKEVVFWRKSSTPVFFNKGDYFFFLIKGVLPRAIRGYGRISQIGVKSLRTMWDLYGNRNGCNTLLKLNNKLNCDNDSEIAHYYLTEVIYLKETETITDEEIGFAKTIIAGKFIDSFCTDKLLKYHKEGIKPEFR